MKQLLLELTLLTLQRLVSVGEFLNKLVELISLKQSVVPVVDELYNIVVHSVRLILRLVLKDLVSESSIVLNYRRITIPYLLTSFSLSFLCSVDEALRLFRVIDGITRSILPIREYSSLLVNL